MSNFTESTNAMIKEAITKICSVYPEVVAIYLFGSFAANAQNLSSDFDLAILFPVSHSVDNVKLWELAQQIAIGINKDVDLIDLRKASTVMQFQIMQNSQRIYCHDAKVADFFADLVYAEYINFNEKRKDLLHDVKTRGGVFYG